MAFGLLIDLASYCIADVIPQGYLMQWLLCAVGIVLVAIGVSCEVAADLLTLAGEGLVRALCSVCPLKFGYMKVIVDVSLVVIAVALSFGFLHGLQGVREGTLAAALLVGLLAKQINRLSVPLAARWIEGKKPSEEAAAAEGGAH